jgi:hypothetical protein
MQRLFRVTESRLALRGFIFWWPISTGPAAASARLFCSYNAALCPIWLLYGHQRHLQADRNGKWQINECRSLQARNKQRYAETRRLLASLCGDDRLAGRLSGPARTLGAGRPARR